MEGFFDVSDGEDAEVDADLLQEFHQDDGDDDDDGLGGGRQFPTYTDYLGTENPDGVAELSLPQLRRLVEEAVNRTEHVMERFSEFQVDSEDVQRFFGHDAKLDKEEDLSKACARHILLLTTLFKVYQAKAGPEPDLVLCLSKAYKGVELMKRYVWSKLSAASYTSDDRKEDSEDVFAEASLGFLSDNKFTPTQRIILRALSKLERLGLARYKGRVCRQIQIHLLRDQDGHELRVRNSEFIEKQKRYDGMEVTAVYKTHTWEDACDMEKIVYDLCSRTECLESFLDFTKCQNIKGIVGFLKNCNDFSFPELRPNYNFRSFTNGILDLSVEESVFYPYGADQEKYLPEGLVCAQHYDRPFPMGYLGNRYLDIPTPWFSKLLRDQRLSEHVIFCCFALLGRCLYSLNEADKWQVILVIKGVAQSGKSTIGNTLRKLFKHEDVAVLSSNIEGKFGLRPLADKKLFICFEMAREFGLPKCDVLNLIEGGWMNLPGKHVEAVTKRWKVPGLFIGNMIADWNDAGGSMSRRLLTLLMQVKITDADMSMDEKIDAEFPLILYKMYRAYTILRKQVGTRSIWDVLPNFFLKVRKDVAAATNPIKTFLLDNDHVILDRKLQVSRMAFDEAARQYLRRAGIKFRTDDLETALRDFKVTRRTTRGTDNGIPHTGIFYVGCGLRRTEETQEYEARENEGLDAEDGEEEMVGFDDSDYEDDEPGDGSSSILVARFAGVISKSTNPHTTPILCVTVLPEEASGLPAGGGAGGYHEESIQEEKKEEEEEQEEQEEQEERYSGALRMARHKRRRVVIDEDDLQSSEDEPEFEIL
jgi:hypothetical protein